MKFPGSTKSKIKKDENGENAPYIEVTEVVLIHWNVVNNSYQQNSRVLYIFITNKSFGQLLDISRKNLYFKKDFIQNFRLLKYFNFLHKLLLTDTKVSKICKIFANCLSANVKF